MSSDSRMISISEHCTRLGEALSTAGFQDSAECLFVAGGLMTDVFSQEADERDLFLSEVSAFNCVFSALKRLSGQFFKDQTISFPQNTSRAISERFGTLDAIAEYRECFLSLETALKSTYKDKCKYPTDIGFTGYGLCLSAQVHKRFKKGVFALVDTDNAQVWTYKRDSLVLRLAARLVLISTQMFFSLFPETAENKDTFRSMHLAVQAEDQRQLCLF